MSKSKYKDDDKYYIYVLKDPDTQLVRYIGKTGDIKQRFRGHIYEATHSDYSDSPCSHKNNWIRKIIDSGKMPIIEAIEEITYERCNEREKYWISYFGRDNLVNETDGGNSSLNDFASNGIYDITKIHEHRRVIQRRYKKMFVKDCKNVLNDFAWQLALGKSGIKKINKKIEKFDSGCDKLDDLRLFIRFVDYRVSHLDDNFRVTKTNVKYWADYLKNATFEQLQAWK